jgi:hypothetical protein
VFCECSDVAGSDEIAQGDVIEWLVPGDDPWRQFGLVVTADCDLALRKHAGIISYVPVLPIRDYVRLFYLPRRLEAEAERIYEALAAQIRRLQGEQRPEFGVPVSDDAVRSAIRGEASAIIRSLRAKGEDEKTLTSRLAAYQACLGALDSLDHDDEIEAFVAAREVLGTPSDKSLPALMRAIQELIERLPGDGFFISALSAVHQGGYVAYLRLVREANENAIAQRQSQLGSEIIEGRRISRLQSPYVYYLTQRLSSVFAAIGLPLEYEDHRAVVAQEQYGAGG